MRSGGGVIGIGSPWPSLESNFALRRLVGAGHFYAGLAEPEQRLLRQQLDILQNGPVRRVAGRAVLSHFWLGAAQPAGVVGLPVGHIEPHSEEDLA